MLDPRNGEVLSLVSLPAYDPERLRRRHRSRDLDVAQHRRAEAAAEPRAPGPLLAGLDLQDGGRHGRARGGRDHAGLPRLTAPAARASTAASSSAGRRAGTAPSTCGTRSSSRATSTSTRSATCSASTGSTSGRRARPGREDRHRPAERGPGPRAVDRVEAPDASNEKWYAGETISVAIGQGQVSRDADLDGGDDDDASPTAAPRYTPHLVKAVDEGQGWKPVPAPPPQGRRSR